MLQTEPTSFQVKSYAKYMFGHYGLIPKKKQNSVLMKAIAFFLDLFKIMDKQKYMRYSSVIGRRVYLPFVIGDPTAALLSNQVAIIAHECEHAYRKKLRGSFIYSWHYLFNTARRALAEVEGYRVNMELHYWYTGKLLSPIKLATKLYSYRCNTSDVDMAYEAFKRLAIGISEGCIGADASKHAIDYFTEVVITPSYKGQGKMIMGDYYHDPMANIWRGVFQKN